MNTKDPFKNLFDTAYNEQVDLETPDGHARRFADRLNQRSSKIAETKVKRPWWKPMSIAASVIVLLGLGYFFINPTPTKTDLASVSPKMEQTQSFFTATIKQELATLKEIETPESKKMVELAVQRITVLENEYSKLKVDLKQSGNDKRVIYAMISNFQNRIDVLQQVIKQIEEINTLKNNNDETII